MRIEWIGSLAVLLLMLVIAHQGICTASEQNLSENTTSVSANSTSKAAAQLIDVAGIWNVSLAGTSIIMALNQSGDSIFGRCKFEGAQPWNGVIAGSLSGNAVNIAIAAVQGEVLVSTDITGTISDDVLQAESVSYDSEGNEASGNATGTRISPDVADYTPAQVKAVAELTPASKPAVVQPPQPAQLAQPSAAQDNQAANSRVKDVTQLARGINANILPWSFPL